MITKVLWYLGKTRKYLKAVHLMNTMVKRNRNYLSDIDNSGEMVVAVDMGTSKIAVLVGKVDATGNFRIIEQISCPSSGIRRGEISDMSAAADAVKKAVLEAEKRAHCKKIRKVIVGIASTRMKSMNNNGMVSITGDTVTARDISRVIEITKTSIRIPEQYTILHAIPKEFRIDEQRKVIDPCGMYGVRLDMDMHIVACSDCVIRNVESCIRESGFVVEDMVLKSIASSESVLTKDKKSHGVCVIDIGGGTTEFTIFHNDFIEYTGIIEQGGDDVTREISAIFSISTRAAEEIKIKHGRLVSENIADEHYLDVMGFENEEKRISSKNLTKVIESEYTQIFEGVFRIIQERRDLSELWAGIVLTGGGAQIGGIVDFMSGILASPMPISIGKDNNIAEQYDSDFSVCQGIMLLRKQKLQKPHQGRTYTVLSKLWSGFVEMIIKPILKK